MLSYTRRATLLQLLGAFALLSILLDPTQSYAQSPWTQVRGRLIGNGYYGATPIAGVVLTLYNKQLGRSARACRDRMELFTLAIYPSARTLLRFGSLIALIRVPSRLSWT